MAIQLRLHDAGLPRDKEVATRPPSKAKQHPVNQGRDVAIQWLRAFAAIEVMIWHSDLLSKGFSPASIHASVYSPLGGIGVEIFFIVSGFLMSLVAQKVPSTASFVLGRLRRLLPLYWAFTSLAVLAFLTNKNWHLGGFELDLPTLLWSYLILPQTNYPILMVGWTLEFEVIFYAMVAVFVAVAARSVRERIGFGLVLAIFGFLGTVFWSEAKISPWVSHILSPYMFAFGFGWLLAGLGTARRQVQLMVWLGFSVPFMAAVALEGPLDRHLLLRIAIAAAVVVTVLALRSLLAGCGRVGRFIGLAGEASYSIYLSHWFVLSILGKLVGRMALPIVADVPVRVAGVIIALLFGTAFYLLIEKPLDQRLRRFGAGGRLSPKLEPLSPLAFSADARARHADSLPALLDFPTQQGTVIALGPRGQKHPGEKRSQI